MLQILSRDSAELCMLRGGDRISVQPRCWAKEDPQNADSKTLDVHKSIVIKVGGVDTLDQLSATCMSGDSKPPQAMGTDDEDDDDDDSSQQNNCFSHQT